MLIWSGNSPAKVNPFHLIANPDITSPGPPLPAQIQAFATAHRSSMTSETEMVQQYNATTFSADDTPLHITKVTKDTIHVVSAQQMQAGQNGGPKRIIQKVGRAFRKPNGEYVETAQVVEGRTVGHEPLHQGAPPRPPVSEGELPEMNSEEDMPRSSLTIEESVEDSEAHSETRRTSIYTSNLTTEPSDLGISPVRPFAQQVPRRSSWNSATSRTGSLAVVRKAKEKEASERERKESKDLPLLPDAADAQRPDAGGLAPPPRVTRRTTNPTPPSPTIAKRSPLVHSQSTFPTVSIPGQHQTTVPGVEGAALDSDILAHSEQIRRERLERRQKKANAENPLEAAAVSPMAPGKPERKGTEDAKVLVGNLIGEDHVNYVLMYNMLTGIRIGVS
jgi:1-phosphatidylinositol-4-phosphate 5-kinase